MKRKLMVLALVLAMLIQILPIAAFAETETVNTESVAEASESAAKNAEVTSEVQYGSTGWVSNPLYPELEEKIAAPQVGNSAEKEAPSGAYTWSTDEIGLTIAKYMEKRTGVFTVYYKSYSAISESQVWQIWDKAFVENNVPTRGDYLKWHWKYVWGSWSWYWSGGVCYTTIEFDVDYHTTASQETALTKRVNEIMSGFNFTSATSDYEKAYTIYKWVTENITYDYDGLDDLYSMAHTAYNGIMYGTCVCQGYASIIYRMYLQAGIPVRTIGGDAYDVYPYVDPDETGDNHCWNIAYIGGKWYNLDATWDEGYAPADWDWFLKCPKNFPDHSRWYEYDTSSFHRTYPMATSDYVHISRNGLVEVNGVWGYYVDDVLQTGYTGLVPYEGKQFYVENGVLTFSYTGLVYYLNEWRYVANSELTEGYTGLVYFNDNWFYTVNSRIDWSFTGLVPYNGNYFYVQNNLLDWGYTGLGYSDGTWYFIQNGLLQLNYTGLVDFNSKWFYVEEGVLTYQYTGMVEHLGNSFYVQNSYLDWSYTGLGYHNGAWYFIQNALLQEGYYGLVNFNSTWFYIEDSQLTWTTNGLRPHNGVLYYITNSEVNWSYNGYAMYNGQYYVVVNGVVENW